VSITDPALSIFGVSTPEEFFDSLSEDDIKNGFANRFLILSDAPSPERAPRMLMSAGVPPSIVEGLARLRALSGGIGGTVIDDRRMNSFAGREPLKWGVGANELWNFLVSRIEVLQERDELVGKLYRRTAEMAVRIATIVAAGRFSNTVDVIDVACGALLAVQSANAMADGFRDAGDGSDHSKRVKRLRGLIDARGSIKHYDLYRRVYQSMDERLFKSALSALIEAGLVAKEMVRNKKGGAPGVVYRSLGVPSCRAS
jgi:hypothetical protein